jgi:hypothetical protein
LVRRAGAAKAVKPRLRLKKRMVSCMVAVARLIGDFLVGCRDGRDSEFFFFFDRLRLAFYYEKKMQ